MGDPSDLNRIAVIMPVKNEVEGLARLLADVLGQGPDEVVVVDAGSHDGTREVLDELARADARLRVVSAPGAFPGAGRNAGVAATRCGIIVHMDGGFRVAPEWLQHLVEPVLSGAADYTTGRVLPMEIPREILGEQMDLGAVFAASLFASPRGPGSVAGGASAAYRREVFERAGGQPGWLRNGADALFAARVKRLGVSQAFAPGSVAFWELGPGFREVFGRAARYARANFLLPPGLAPVRRQVLHLGAAAALLVTVAALPLGWLLSAALAAAYVARCARRALGRLDSRFGPPAGTRRPVAFLLLAMTHVTRFSGEALGTIRGLLAWRADAALRERGARYLDGGAA